MVRLNRCKPEVDVVPFPTLVIGAVAGNNLQLVVEPAAIVAKVVVKGPARVDGVVNITVGPGNVGTGSGINLLPVKFGVLGLVVDDDPVALVLVTGVGSVPTTGLEVAVGKGPAV